VAKKRVGKFPKAFRQIAVDRLNQCDNIEELAKELGRNKRGWESFLAAWSTATRLSDTAAPPLRRGSPLALISMRGIG